MCETDRNVSESSLAVAIKNSTSTSGDQGHNAVLPTAFSFASTPNCPMTPNASLSPAILAEYQQRLQLYDYATQAAVRFRLSHPAFVANVASAPYNIATAGYTQSVFSENSTSFASLSPFARFDPRFRFIHEEPKPQHSYIGLIAMAILSSPEKKMVLSDIYQYILDNYPYFRNRGPGWRNSIRHNLSLNDCFIKAGRSANGKGHYWAIHTANIEDFKKGDFRRRKAQRKVRKHMGLSVPDDEDSPSPTPTPTSIGLSVTNSICNDFSQPLIRPNAHTVHGHSSLCPNFTLNHEIHLPAEKIFDKVNKTVAHANYENSAVNLSPSLVLSRSCKRQFDVESLLAPDSTVVDTPPSNEESHDKSETAIAGNASIADEERSNCSLSPSNEIAASNEGCNSKSPSPSHPNKKPALLHVNCEANQAPSSLWHAAQIQSLQNLHQINAGLISHSLRAGFPTWAVSSAFTNPQTAANFLGYTALTAANSLVSKIGDVPISSSAK
ncbi:fork head domain-containing protein FD5-like protein [Dinothrombium tinctorium]|uniref:Fork head domain-containing protein FD5-like protein n=1 Tax=Dinothrombium tinctorium TaxID=1965070 RepID=A0A3S3P2W1_9ACAR|nr:fork head domain-containing protein FD5-like protein [Dinothrombium tinctorium]